MYFDRDCFCFDPFALMGLRLFRGGRFFTLLKAAARDSELDEFVPRLVERFFVSFFVFDDLLLPGETCFPVGYIEEFNELILLSDRLLLVLRSDLSDAVLYSKLGPLCMRLLNVSFIATPLVSLLNESFYSLLLVVCFII